MKYGVKRKATTACHPQTCDQAKISNHKIKRILEKVVSPSNKDWSLKLDDSLWAYIIAFKTLIGMTPYLLVFGKSCLLSFELKHKAYWVIQNLNFDAKAHEEQR